MEKLYEILDSISKRVSNPLLLSFGISWLVTNYKVIVVFLSNDGYAKKFFYSEYVLYPQDGSPSIKLFWIPLAAALVYLGILPIISLGTTWLNATFENWHERLRLRILKKAVWSDDRADAFKKDTAALVKKLEKDLQEANTGKLESSLHTSAALNKIFKNFLPLILKTLPEEAAKWEPIRRPSNQTALNVQAQDDFIVKYGIPAAWESIFKPPADPQLINVLSAARSINKTEDETLQILFKLSAMGMLDPQWVDNTITFTIAGGSWGDLLNGRA
ncbi:hypothetical protein [Duganella sp. LjRoot269]|jgi:hypothetical protein|uniref:hypothetical protein n=1 Tax=Duganella sp. LjRoot269 TaxID=3342305 RepID=UPI003ECF3D63